MAFSKSDTSSTLVELLTLLILGLVVVAGLIGNAVVVGVHPDPGVVPALTGPGVSTVDDILDRQVGRRPGTFPLDVDSVCQGAGAAVGPAGPAVLGDVLVPSGAGVIHPVHVPPVPALRQRRHVQVLVRAGVRPESGSLARGRLVAVLPFPEVEPGAGGRAEAAAEQ